MDHTPPKYCQCPSLCASQEESIQDKTKENPFAEDPICNLNLKETPEFVKSLPMGYGSQSLAHKRREKGNNAVVCNSMATKMESPSTPGRPVFSFSSSVSRKNVPSKWDDAEKWLFSGGSCHASPAHPPFNANQTSKGSNSKGSTKENVVKQQQNIQVRSSTAFVEDQYQFNGLIVPSDVPLKDKLTDGIELFSPNMRYAQPTNESFIFKSQKPPNEPMKDASTEVLVQKFEEVKLTHRDIGTDMTPKGSSTTSRCYTPFMNTSPTRHNTPASRSRVSAPVAQTNPIDLTKQVQECHLAKLQVESTPLDWSSREEEEKEISKSLRHFEIGRMSVAVSEPRPCAWELEEEKTKSCARYQREEARIQAWVDLQTAKAEAQSRKLEVKIQKMRSQLEQKLLKKRAIVQRKAEEWRAAAQAEHSDQIRRASQRTQKHNHVFNFKPHTHNSHNFSPQFMFCACFRCTSNRKN